MQQVSQHISKLCSSLCTCLTAMSVLVQLLCRIFLASLKKKSDFLCAEEIGFSVTFQDFEEQADQLGPFIFCSSLF